MRTLLLVAAAVALAGCIDSKVYVLKNMATGEVVRCERNSGASFFPIAQTAIDNSYAENCAAGYRAAGYTQMN